MKPIASALSLLALLIALPPAARAEDFAPGSDAHELIEAADKVRNPATPFSLTNLLTEYKDGKAASSTMLAVYAKIDPASRQFRNIVRFVEPPRDAGKMVLMDGTKMWFYDPDSKASVPISPQQRLIGQASDGDVVTVNYARDYGGKVIGEEKLLDADHKERDCWHLDMVAADADAVYSRLELWLEKGTFYGVKSKHYSDSGRLLKIAYYHNYAPALGGQRAGQTIIIDAVDSKLVTTMDVSDWQTATLPDSWFQRDFLPRVNFE